jgi:outer membrane protein assembly factor BamB
MKRLILAMLFVIFSGDVTFAGSWPTYRADAARTGYTSDPLPDITASEWEIECRHAPQPAWRGVDTRMTFDCVFQPVASDGAVYFGSSVDGAIRAIEAKRGRRLWTFHTDAPVRFAPALLEDRLFAVSDDGYLYCLDAKSGKLHWRRRGGPDGGMVLGNARMVDRRPARGGVAIVGDVVYFAAGIWPSEGICVHAVHAVTGEPVWTNDTAGGLEMDQPHPTARAFSGISAQGYLTVAGDQLFVPTGRSVPAALNRSDGAFRYFHLQKYGRNGGAAITATDDYLFNGDCLFDSRTGELIVRGIPTERLAITPEFVVYGKGNRCVGIRRNDIIREIEAVDRKGNNVVKKVLTKPAWSVELEHQVERVIAASNTIVAAGSGDDTGRVSLIDIQTHEMRSSVDVKGSPGGLAVAGGRLFVSTDAGRLYCFVNKRFRGSLRTTQTVKPFKNNDTYAQAAEEIIERSGVTKGYCLDLGCGDGRLSYELAKRSDLQIYAVDKGETLVVQARNALDGAGLYGSRVTVHHRKLDATGYPNYFADLIVSGRSVSEGPAVVSEKEVGRLQRPFGGVAILGQPGAMTKTVRGPLEGAATWTHQYCNPANTSCSTDTRVKGPLGMLWFGDLPIAMPNRHGRGPAPLFADGRLIVEGLHRLCALNAYNGRELWRFDLTDILKPYDQDHLAGVAVTGSNYCMDRQAVYVAVDDRCLRIDAATGERIGEFKAPAQTNGGKGTWGYVAVEDGTLFGSLCRQEHVVRHAFRESDMTQQFSESKTLFAMDAQTGRVKWTYPAKHSIRHNTIAIGGEHVYLIDRPLAVKDRPKEVARDEAHPPGELVALDAGTGREIYRIGDVWGTMLALSVKHDVLLMAYQSTRFRLPSEKPAAMSAHRASTGEPLWHRDDEYASRPLINDRTVYAQPGAWDLLTGEPKSWTFTRSYGCGILAGSRNLMVFRSATLGYYDLLTDGGTQNYGGMRPGCWINAIPAGGLVLVPDATAGCTCSYLIKSTIALQPME